MPDGSLVTPRRVLAAGGVAVAALLAALLAPGRRPEGLGEALALAVPVTAGEGEEARCVVGWGGKTHDGCYLAGALRAVDEQPGPPDWRRAQWAA